VVQFQEGVVLEPVRREPRVDAALAVEHQRQTGSFDGRQDGLVALVAERVVQQVDREDADDAVLASHAVDLAGALLGVVGDDHHLRVVGGILTDELIEDVVVHRPHHRHPGPAVGDLEGLEPEAGREHHLVDAELFHLGVVVLRALDLQRVLLDPPLRPPVPAVPGQRTPLVGAEGVARFLILAGLFVLDVLDDPREGVVGVDLGVAHREFAEQVVFWLVTRRTHSANIANTTQRSLVMRSSVVSTDDDRHAH
jgi:hypothetical protein